MSIVEALQGLVAKASTAVDWVEFAKSFPRLRCILEDHAEERAILYSEAGRPGGPEYLSLCSRCRCVYIPEKHAP